MCGKLKEMQKDNALSNIRIKTNNYKDNRELESVSNLIFWDKAHINKMCLRISPCVKEHFFHSIFCTQPPVRKYLSKKAIARNSGNQITPLLVLGHGSSVY